MTFRDTVTNSMCQRDWATCAWTSGQTLSVSGGLFVREISIGISGQRAALPDGGDPTQSVEDLNRTKRFYPPMSKGEFLLPDCL